MQPPYQGPPGPFGAPQPPPQQQSVYRPTPGTYEFTEPENAVLRKLSGTMKLVVYAQAASLVVALLSVVVKVARMSSNTQRVGGVIGGSIGLVFAGIFSGLIAYFLWSSASAFDRVVTTQGDDMPNLVEALSSQRSYFAMIKWMMVLALAAVVLACIGGMFFAASGHNFAP